MIAFAYRWHWAPRDLDELDADAMRFWAERFEAQTKALKEASRGR